MFGGDLMQSAQLYYRATKEIFSNLRAGKHYYCEPLNPDVNKIFMLDCEIRSKVFLRDPKEANQLKRDEFGMVTTQQGIEYIMKGDQGELLFFHCRTRNSRILYEKIGQFREVNGGAKAEDKLIFIVLADSDADYVENYPDIQQYRMNLSCVEDKMAIPAPSSSSSSSSSSSTKRQKRKAAKDAKVAQEKKGRSG